MDEEIRKLRQEVAELRKQIDETDDWANGIQMSLLQVLPLLLRDHPAAEKVQHMLAQSDSRYEELNAHPRRGGKHETPALYESRKMLYRQLALLGVWPGIDANRFAQESMQRYLQDAQRQQG